MVDQIQEINKHGWQVNNNTEDEMPVEMTFNDGHIVSIVTYSILMVVTGVANVTVLVLLLRKKRNARSHVNQMIMHLAIADLMVGVNRWGKFKNKSTSEFVRWMSSMSVCTMCQTMTS